MITDFFTTSFTVKRAVWATDGGGNSYSEEVNVSTFNGNIQQAQPELIQNLGMSLTKAYTVWCDLSTDVKEGDTLISGSINYSVRAIQNYEMGGNTHLELVVEKDNVTS